ncbi:phytochrome-like protein cph2 [mine drainage metagenome]|uniref:Phytochrome-like protein cph2 n=1 Tax=mine drainage metagenome TaxID=410659 RepID=A0A1J5RUQ0_9ZZZZ
MGYTIEMNRAATARGRRMSPDSRTLRRALTPVNALIVLLAAGTAALFLGPVRALAPNMSSLEVPWWTVAIGFGLAEVFVVHLPMARSARTFAFRELPSVVALVFLSPNEYLAAALVGSGLALVVFEHQRGSKLAFNVAMFGVEAGVAILVYRAVLGNAHTTEPQSWVAALVAMIVTGLLSCVLVTFVIYLAGDGWTSDILREATRSGIVASAANTSLALLSVVLLTVQPAALSLLGVVVAVVFLSYRGYVAFAGRYSQLELLYRFVGTVGASVDLDRTTRSVLSEARDVLASARGELIVLATDSSPGQHVVLVDDVLTQGLPPGREGASEWWSPAAAGTSVIVQRGDDRTRSRLPAALADAMAVPIDIDGMTAVLVVADRLFTGRSFSEQDLHLFEALAGHASITLQNARLVDIMRKDAATRDHEARHDPLTGLPNRRELHTRFEDVARDGELAMLMLDLDDFKEINDTLGHDAGDHVLREIGRRLQETTTGVVARLGGDEFAILLPGVGDPGDALEQGASLLDAIRKPVALNDVNLVVGGSIGVALYPVHGESSDILLTHADVAMYSAKVAGTGIETYTPDPETGRHRRLALAAQMEAAIENGGITLWYQPKLDTTTGDLVGVEGLVRWIHPVYGLVSPAEIIPVAERTGLVRRLTDHLLETALRQQAVWRVAGLDVTVAVNITTRDLVDDKLPLMVERLVAESGGRPDRLTLEITESGIMRDLDRSLGILDGLAAIGVKLSIDDFGTGYSSLAYLERLPVSEVKIDRSFVQWLSDPSHNSTVLQSTIQMSHALGLSVVAEGVESQPVWDILATLGADVIQGYHVAYPMPASAVAAWCRPAGSVPGARIPPRLSRLA